MVRALVSHRLCRAFQGWQLQGWEGPSRALLMPNAMLRAATVE